MSTADVASMSRAIFLKKVIVIGYYYEFFKEHFKSQRTFTLFHMRNALVVNCTTNIASGNFIEL